MTKLTPLEQANHDKGLKIAKVHKDSELQLIDILKNADEFGYFRKMGFGSLYEYANVGLGLTEAVSYNLMSIARKSRKVPELKEALETGTMTVSNAKLLVSVITPENKDHWIVLGKDLSKAKLEREVAKVSPKAAIQERASFVSGEIMKVVMALSSETHEILKRVLDLESQRTGKPASYDDAIIAMGAIYLRAKDPIEKAKRASEKAKIVSKRPDRAENKSFVNSPRGELKDQQISKSEKSAANHEPPKIEIPFVRHPQLAKLKHQITTRDQARCTQTNPRGERCESRRWLETHHKVPISLGGTNHLNNLSTLCRAHHSMHHSRGNGS